MTPNKKIQLEKRMLKVTTYLKDRKKRNAKNSFIEKFSLCEACCKFVITSYNKEDYSKIKLNLGPIRASMKGIKFDDTSLSKIFSGKSGSYYKRGTYSAKNLRDSILHELSTESMEEVYNRKEELNKLMDSYLKLFLLKTIQPYRNGK